MVPRPAAKSSGGVCIRCDGDCGRPTRSTWTLGQGLCVWELSQEHGLLDILGCYGASDPSFPVLAALWVGETAELPPGEIVLFLDTLCSSLLSPTPPSVFSLCCHRMNQPHCCDLLHFRPFPPDFKFSSCEGHICLVYYYYYY